MLHTWHAVPPSKIVHPDHPVRAPTASLLSHDRLGARRCPAYCRTRRTALSAAICWAFSGSNGVPRYKRRAGRRWSTTSALVRRKVLQLEQVLPAAAREGAMDGNRVQHACYAFRERGKHHRAHLKERVTWPMPRPLSGGGVSISISISILYLYLYLYPPSISISVRPLSLSSLSLCMYICPLSLSLSMW